MASVHFEQVAHRRPGAFDALGAFDLDIDDGEIVAFVGPAGSGASTALRLLAGFEDPDHGTIRIGSCDLAGLAPRDRNVALVLPHHALYPGLTAAEHLVFPLLVAGLPEPARTQRVRAVALRMGLDDLLTLRPDELTAAERQRVALGRAIIRHPDVLLMDEPLAALDAASRTAVRSELERLRDELEMTTIAVVSDRFDGLAIGERILEFDAGACRSGANLRLPA